MAAYTIRESDINLLRQTGVSEDDIDHCVKVAQKALEIAVRCAGGMDMELIARGALFHDLGKSETHDIEHGKIGAELGKALGLPTAITDIMEKHIRGGLTPDEARELGLPVKDYSLKTIEEKIVIYADRLVDIIYDGIVELSKDKEAEDKFVEILTKYPQYGKNEITLRRYIAYHDEIQGLMAKA
ncbi:MAG: HDIG domain-containing protein [Nitrospirae bacterium]|nr:HDIG domain-containing protein [Nitrospirota bacterium]